MSLEADNCLPLTEYLGYTERSFYLNVAGSRRVLVTWDLGVVFICLHTYNNQFERELLVMFFEVLKFLISRNIYYEPSECSHMLNETKD